MKKAVGLRCEIVVSSSLLVGAALLFVALLLLRLSETSLLEQTVTIHSRNAQSLSSLLSVASEAQLPRLLEGYAHTNQLGSWQLVDDHGKFVAGSGKGGDSALTRRRARQMLLWQPVEVDLHYPPSWRWIVGDHDSSRYVDLRVAITSDDGGRLMLQLRYSLQGIYNEMVTLQKVALICCLAYGLVLVMTAVFILNRSVVKPIVRLTASTQLISQGDLDQQVEPTGPREINTMAQAFNRMAQSLRSSAEQQRLQLEKLQHSNKQLQLAHHHLAQSERMASVGNLTSGIAHELGNPLSAVIGYLELLKKKPVDEASHNLVVRALDESGRMDQLLKDMLDFAGAGMDDGISSCDPVTVIEQTCAMLGNQGVLKRRQLTIDLADNLAAVAIAPHKLQQILVNLLINARDATIEGGQITISAAAADGQVEIAVADDGEGISPERQLAVFDPFFTTKAPGKGRGLGLYVSYQLVNDCGGSISVDSTPQQGSRFSIITPLHGESDYAES